MIYAFEEFELDTAVFELRSPDGVVDIEPQVFNVMRYLIERLVTSSSPRKRYSTRIWGDRFVSESALTSRIKSARQGGGRRRPDATRDRHRPRTRGPIRRGRARGAAVGEGTLTVEAGEEHASATRLVEPGARRA